MMIKIEDLKKEYKKADRVIEQAFWADRLTYWEKVDVENAKRKIRDIEEFCKTNNINLAVIKG